MEVLGKAELRSIYVVLISASALVELLGGFGNGPRQIYGNT